MANTASATKKIRVDERRKKFNDLRKQAYKEAVKDVKKYLAAGDVDSAVKALPNAHKTLDKATKANSIKAGKASRVKSQLAKKLASLSK